MKYSLEEFNDCDVNDIINEMDNPSVSKTKVDSGQTNTCKVAKESEEDNMPREGMIFYDIRFSVYHGEEQIKILINIEAQKCLLHNRNTKSCRPKTEKVASPFWRKLQLHQIVLKNLP